MSKFTDLYKNELAGSTEKSSDNDIRDNPLLAFVHGVSEEKIKQVLLDDDWSPSEVSQLLQEARKAKNNQR